MPRQERKDIKIGTKFAKLLVLDNIYINGTGFLKVKCDCGHIEIKRKWPVKVGKLTECLKCSIKATGIKRRRGYKELSAIAFSKIKADARKMNREFNLSMIFLYELFLKQNKKCALSGIEISLDNYKLREFKHTASVDRINSSKGYTEDNVQWVHKDINYMKQAYSSEYFIKMCKLVAENNK